MGSWTAGARAPCRRGRAGPGCSVSVSTPPPCTASPLTRAAGPPSHPSQPLGRSPVQSPLRGCQCPHPPCSLSPAPGHHPLSVQLLSSPLASLRAARLHSSRERPVDHTFPLMDPPCFKPSQRQRSATLGLESALHSQPSMLQPHWAAGSRAGPGAPGAPLPVPEPQPRASPRPPDSVQASPPPRRSSGLACPAPPVHQLAASLPPRGPPAARVRDGLSLWAPALAPPQRKASSLREQRPRCSLPPGPGTKEALCNPQMTE